MSGRKRFSERVLDKQNIIRQTLAIEDGKRSISTAIFV